MRYLFAILLASFWISPLHAAVSPKDELAQTQKDMEAARARQSEITEKTRKIEGELRDLQEQLVVSAQAVQAGETDLSVSEEKLKLLSDQMQKKTAALETREANLSSLIQAALRLSKTPPEAVVMMPGNSAQTIKAARALKMASASIRQEIGGIRLQVNELALLKQRVAANKSEFTKKKSSLDKIRESLKTRLEARQELREKLGREQKEQGEKLDQLAKKAQDLQDLVSSLKTAEKPSGGQKGKLRSFTAAKGQIRMPVAGKVVQSFGMTSGRNETSKGMTIDARGGSPVTAPYDGEVVFTGPFRGYGKLVIIRHSDDFHTLLAGLDKIDTSPGEFLLEGEPIGAMGEKTSANRLYVELRKENHPIDPSPWIHGSKSRKESE